MFVATLVKCFLVRRNGIVDEMLVSRLLMFSGMFFSIAGG